MVFLTITVQDWDAIEHWKCSFKHLKRDEDPYPQGLVNQYTD